MVFRVPETECLFQIRYLQKCEEYSMGKMKNIIHILLTLSVGGFKDSVFIATHF